MCGRSLDLQCFQSRPLRYNRRAAGWDQRDGWPELLVLLSPALPLALIRSRYTWLCRQVPWVSEGECLYRTCTLPASPDRPRPCEMASNCLLELAGLRRAPRPLLQRLAQLPGFQIEGSSELLSFFSGLCLLQGARTTEGVFHHPVISLVTGKLVQIFGILIIGIVRPPG